VTADFFTPIVDDPYDFGRIAATNALSDIYAMGARPLFVLNLVGFPRKLLAEGILEEILRGGSDVARAAGVPTLGGHSIDDAEPKYGMVAVGDVDPARMVTNAGARPGDVLVLTKPIGSGVIATAIKQGTAPADVVAAAVDAMTTLNRGAAEAMVAAKALLRLPSRIVCHCSGVVSTNPPSYQGPTLLTSRSIRPRDCITSEIMASTSEAWRTSACTMIERDSMACKAVSTSEACACSDRKLAATV
jgi:hypothetical protein